MKTLYDVLNLQKNCSLKEIKDAFISLSKKYHPDKNKSLDAQQRFIEINEAYSILGKKESRRRYDESLLFSRKPNHYSYASARAQPVYQTPYEHMQMKYKNRPYYWEASYSTSYDHRNRAAIIICSYLLFIFGTTIMAREIRNQKRRYSRMALVKASVMRKEAFKKFEEIKKKK